MKNNQKTKSKLSIVASALLLSTVVSVTQAADRLPYQDYVKNAGGNSSTQAAAAIINDNDNNVFDDVETEINDYVTASALSNNNAVNMAISSTTAQITTANLEAGSQIMSGIQSIVNSRQNVNVGLNSGDSLLSEKKVWIKPYFSKGTQNDKNNINGFDVNTKGLGIGVDGEYDTNSRIGLAFFYTQAEVDVNNVSQSSNIDVMSALVYGNIPIIDNQTSFLYQVGYSMQKTSSKRDIFNNDVAKANYTSTIASADLKLMRNFQINEKLLLQPIVGLTYSSLKTPSYSENGAGVLNLQVESSTSNEFVANIGTQAKYNLQSNSAILGSMELDYNFNDESTVTSSFQGAQGTTFDTKGIDNGKFGYKLGMGYEIKNILGGEINFMYDYQAQGDFVNNVVSSKYTMKF